MRWVSPFGHPRIKACSQLPMAFRRVPRPSSPLDTKASTKCSSHTLYQTYEKIYLNKIINHNLSLSLLKYNQLTSTILNSCNIY